MDEGRRWPGELLGLLMLAGLVVVSVNAVTMTLSYQDDVLVRPAPPIGTWSAPEWPEMVRYALARLGIAMALAVVPLLLLRRLGRDAGVTTDRLLLASTTSLLLIGIFAGRLQEAGWMLLGMTPDEELGNTPGATLTPLVEEALKLLAVAVALRLGSPRSGTRTGLLLGAAAGIGMTVGETVQYATLARLPSSDESGLATIALRFSLLGFGLHATTTAVSGAALGAWLARGGRRAGLGIFLGGFLLAVATHGAWNTAIGPVGTAVAGWVVPPLDPSPFAWYVIGSIASIPFLAPSWTVLAVAWRRSAGPLSAAGSPASPGLPAGPAPGAARLPPG